MIGARLIRHQIEAVRQTPDVVAALAETRLSPRDLTPHTLRRTVATITAQVAGRAHAAVLLGHSDQRTLETYYLHRETPVVSARLLDELLQLPREEPLTAS